MSGMSSEQFMQRVADFIDRFERTLPATPSAVDWSSTFAARWSMEGQLCQLRPLQVSLSLRLDDLVGVDRQKQLLESNTGQFVRGLPANNALLWGARGTGKSSLVRALLSEHAQAGMRLIEVDKADLVHLSALLPLLAGQPWRFVLFCDDLAFEADDSGYKALKTVLDGTVEASPENILLYATSNRRHLLPEHNSDNLSARQVDGEIHPGEAIEEKIALSDRFGLWVSFYPFSQEHYLAVVQKWLGQLAGEYGLQWQWDEPLQLEALRWATGRGNRNGRCAYQFARSWVGRQLLGN
ncbi:ATP-binding protein [Halopseudomonas aestusnigri]|jgi:predicted AAA+ superfamily ATPase|uniref:ATP-binding protein n=2 Tax=Halopseudomonas aestusnigri TaxID=857252 RepID=UPI000C958EC2|nr:ATP-binding protein [Halopseudomonas aestusnigri]MAK73133.1 AAA family ATPase [Pseudomonadales bacterium]HBT56818.1 AAA family ATPase [Pseudomonas sp.]MAP75599.1 AAA family ATPase [Pseudomonadales bacterium]MCK5532066.1 ATP-binding protein [Halopseudomonas aestusnigri]UGV32582.1 ATP-binding protein [Halopseudomonas aestusnigri]|tara:strand:- start:1922 stop:2809 length:888 start_codon:yes stop_codon:yes gene_type:complete